MRNSIMPEPENKAEFVKTNFDLIAKKYDLFNDLSTFYMHRHWKNQMIRKIRQNMINAELICLDLCCGTGDISVRLNENRQTKTIYSVDFSKEMLEIAKHRLSHFRSSIVQQGDATNLTGFENDSLDVVTVGFGLRNVMNLQKSLSEIYRVLRPGGIFINLDVGKVRNPFVRIFANFYFFKIVPLIGYIVWGGKNKMFDYLPVSSLYYPDQDSLKKLMKETGFKKVNYKNFVFGNSVLHWGKK